MSNEEAAKLVDNKRYQSIQNGEDFSFETVLSSQYKLDILRKAKVVKIAKNLIKMGMSNEDIATATQLTEEEIEEIRD